MGRFYSDHFVKQHHSLKPTCDRAERIWHDLLSVFPVSILISWGQTPPLGTKCGEKQAGWKCPPRCPLSQEAVPIRADCVGQICKEVFIACASTHRRLQVAAHPLPAEHHPPNASMPISSCFVESSDHTSVF